MRTAEEKLSRIKAILSEPNSDDALVQAVRDLSKFKVTGKYPLARVSRTVNGSGMYDPGDDATPFFSEAFLYNLLGKQDARTLLALIERVALAATGSPLALERWLNELATED